MKIFVHTNEVQWLGAKIAAHSFRRALRGASDISVEVLCTAEFSEIRDFHGHQFNHKGQTVRFDYNDIQSFTLLRLAVPEIVNYKTSAVVVDPDVFWARGCSPRQLFDYATSQTPVACVFDRHWRTSVMVMETSRLRDWSLSKVISQLKAGVDYKDLIELRNIDQSIINRLPASFNCFDSLPADGKILHFTRRQTQPWRTGLPLRAKFEGEHRARRFLKAVSGRNKHIRHPNSDLEKLFFELAKDAYCKGEITRSDIELAQANGLVRPDFLNKITSDPLG